MAGTFPGGESTAGNETLNPLPYRAYILGVSIHLPKTRAITTTPMLTSLSLYQMVIEGVGLAPPPQGQTPCQAPEAAPDFFI